MNTIKSYLLLITVLLPLFCQGQNNSVEWAPIGARWSANTSGMFFKNKFSVFSRKDTVVDGRRARCINHAGENDSTCAYVIHARNDSVWYYNEFAKEFRLVYNFNAQPGDTVDSDLSYLDLGNGLCTINESRIVIDSIGKILWGADTLRIQWIHHPNENNWGCQFRSNVIIEKIGSLDFLLPRTFPNAEVYTSFECYSDNECDFNFSKKDFENLNYTASSPTRINICDFEWGCDTLLVSKDPIQLVEAEISVFPNPTNSILNIKASKSRIKKIRLLDFLGRKINMPLNYLYANEIKISLSSIDKGIYFLELTDGRGAKIFRRIVVE